MNRISRLLHKMNFLARQRRAVKYSHRYVITVKDIQLAAAEREKPKDLIDDDPDIVATQVLEGFDPINNE